MMKDNKNSLLAKIKSLYIKLFLVSLHNRIDNYHSFIDSGNHYEISDSLYKLIDEIVKDATHSYSIHDYKTMKFANNEHSTELTNTNKLETHTTTMVSMTLNGLSVYLKKQNVQENDHDMSSKLERCVWDHVHSAHRLARSGDGITAKLHADIACNAMKALSHYMPSEKYSDFYTEINNQISENNNTK